MEYDPINTKDVMSQNNCLLRYYTYLARQIEDDLGIADHLDSEVSVLAPTARSCIKNALKKSEWPAKQLNIAVKKCESFGWCFTYLLLLYDI